MKNMFFFLPVILIIFACSFQSVESPSIDSITNGRKKITVLWKPVRFAEDYYIYRSDDDGNSYKKVAVTDSNSNSYEEYENLFPLKKYYYKISAYTNMYGETSLSSPDFGTIAEQAYVVKYLFNNTTEDSSKFHNNGSFVTKTGDAVEYLDSNFSGKKAMKFIGAEPTSDSRYVITPNLKGAMVKIDDEKIDTSISIACWIYPYVTSPQRGGVIAAEFGQPTIKKPWQNSQIELDPDGSVWIKVWPIDRLKIGKITSFGSWHHVIMRYDSNSKKLDGFLDGTKSTDSKTGERMPPWENEYGFDKDLHYAFGCCVNTYNGKDDLSIVPNKDGGGRFFNGLIDNIYIYNYAIDDNTAAALKTVEE